MPEILVISGKGGTGKTSLTAALAHLAHQVQPPVICDLDVDAPDLHLLLHPEVVRSQEFVSGHQAMLDPTLCTGCGLCQEMCRFQAIEPSPQGLRVLASRCEGCKVCVHFCPAQAIAFEPRHCGSWYVSETRFGPLVHAQLFPGQENSGRLVTLLRKEAKVLARAQGRELILCDGTPGIGCPVISSLSGVDLAVVVTEPTPSGLHDLGRVVELCGHFRTPAAVIINKHGLNQDMSNQIAEFCQGQGLPVLARLPHDPAMVLSMVAGQAITEYDDSALTRELRQAWRAIQDLAKGRRAA